MGNWRLESHLCSMIFFAMNCFCDESVLTQWIACDELAIKKKSAPFIKIKYYFVVSRTSSGAWTKVVAPRKCFLHVNCVRSIGKIVYYKSYKGVLICHYHLASDFYVSTFNARLWHIFYISLMFLACIQEIKQINLRIYGCECAV